MNTITIPKKLAKEGDLILIPRKKYEELLERQAPIAYLTAKERKAVDLGRKEFTRGKSVSLSELKNELRSSRRK